MDKIDSIVFSIGYFVFLFTIGSICLFVSVMIFKTMGSYFYVRYHEWKASRKKQLYEMKKSDNKKRID